MNRETRFKLLVKKELEQLKNIWFFKTQEVAVRGIPDFIICLNGYFVALELKPDAKIHLEPLQEHVLNAIEKNGRGIALKTTPQNLPKTLDLLRQIDRKRVKLNFKDLL